MTAYYGGDGNDVVDEQLCPGRASTAAATTISRDFNAGGAPDAIVLSAAIKSGTIFFDQGGYAWIATATPSGYDYLAIAGGTTASAAQSQIVWQ